MKSKISPILEAIPPLFVSLFGIYCIIVALVSLSHNRYAEATFYLVFLVLIELGKIEKKK